MLFGLKKRTVGCIWDIMKYADTNTIEKMLTDDREEILRFANTLVGFTCVCIIWVP